MSEESLERRLTTILSADVAGYSRLMGEDESATLALLKAHRKELIEPKAAQYGGRTVKLMGDGALMEFGSVVDAVLFAIEVQCAMRERNADVPEGRQIIYRLGINIGDIIVEGDDIYGDGVNVAARLEGLAEPGGICVSRTVFDHIKGKVDLDFEDLGDQEVKNIAEPVRVYRAILDEKAAALVTPVVLPHPPSTRRAWSIVVPALCVLLLALGGALWWFPRSADFEPASVERMALPLPDKPSIAVLPFDNMSGDSEQAYFADGITEDLITDLSKLSGVFVIARNSTFTYKDKPTKVQQVAEDLGVRYVLEGSVRRAGDQVRINAQLVDALSGHHLWAERYDGSMGDVFALQDEVIGKIVAALAVSLTTDETVQAAKAETEVPQAYDAFLQGWDYYLQETPEDITKAIAEFEKAIELDPDYGRAHAGLAAAYWNVVLANWELTAGIQWQHAFDRMKDSVERAKADVPPVAFAYGISAELRAMWGDYEEALAEIDQAIALDPNSAKSYVSKARILNASGRAEEAEENARLAMRLNPHYRPDDLRVLGRALFHQERYEEAAEIYERTKSRQPDHYLGNSSLASTYGHLGRLEEAKAAIEKYDEIMGEMDYTPLTLHEAGLWWGGDLYHYDKLYVERYLEGLRKAGVRPGVPSQIGDADYKASMTKTAGEYDVEGVTKIDVATAKALVDRGVVVVDVRDAGSFGRGRIPGAANLDLNVDLTEENLSRLVGKDDEVIFHCWGKYCPYSTYACAKAVVWGFTRVYYFSGGFPAWQDAGHPVEGTESGM